MTNHTRAILPLFRKLASTRDDVTVKVRRRRTQYRTTYLVEGTTWELNGHGERRAPIGVFTLASWSPTTGELFADDGDRVSGGYWDTIRETARANKHALDDIAAYAAFDRGIAVNVHSNIPQVTRPRHFRIGY
jgi:hypothetical protein